MLFRQLSLMKCCHWFSITNNKLLIHSFCRPSSYFFFIFFCYSKTIQFFPVFIISTLISLELGHSNGFTWPIPSSPRTFLLNKFIALFHSTFILFSSIYILCFFSPCFDNNLASVNDTLPKIMQTDAIFFSNWNLIQLEISSKIQLFYNFFSKKENILSHLNLSQQ